MLRRIGIGLSVAGAVTLGVYLPVIRPWQLRWGATGEEVARPMPGDAVMQHATFNATRSVTVYAPPQDIFPWLVQMGIKRAGWYSYDRIDNLGIPSAEGIIPELQHLQVGSAVPMSPDGKVGLWVRDYERDKWLLWWDRKGEVTWCWGLYPIRGGTRLVSRVRMHYNWLSPWILGNLLLDVGDIIMMRKCMFGIKRSAERLAHERAGALPARA